MTEGAGAFVSKEKPGGALRIIVPVLMSPMLVSWMTGPVRLVELVVPAVSAEIAPPPVAEVIVAARALPTLITKTPLYIYIYLLQQFSSHSLTLNLGQRRRILGDSKVSASKSLRGFKAA
jgi:hypothetical protein